MTAAPRTCAPLFALAITSLCAGATEIPVATPADIARACDRAKPGDALVMAEGVWRDADIVFRGRAEAGMPITLRAQTPGKTILSGRSRLRIAGEHLVVSGLLFRDGWPNDSAIEFRADSKAMASNCRLTGCAIADYSPPTDDAAAKGSKWVSLYGLSNRVDHCYFTGKKDLGTTLVVWVGDLPNGHRIDHNHFGPRPPLGRNGGETIRVGTSEVSMSESATLVEENYFDGCDGEIEVISNKSCGNTYRHNTFVACTGTLTLRHGNRCSVEGNWFFGNGKRESGGIRIIGEDHRISNNYLVGLEGDGARSAISFQMGLPDSPLHGYFQVKRAAVAFNTIIDSKSPLAIGVANGDSSNLLAPVDCEIANNLIVCRQGRPPIALMDPRSQIRWAGNLVAVAPEGTRLPDGVRHADLPMRGPADGVSRPAADGPARAAATTDAPWVTDDIDGQRRNGPRDVGCDQTSDAPALHRPLAPKDVGPDWMKRD
ncbi:MAG TPA: polysaccharide lyase 6 family protein [Verrucomicrobiae bacterium]|nr:polysaccharide lyase 6 family protein [Verrucomicrobiae bacterium]